MNYSERINEDLKQAMREKARDKLEALRAVKTAFTLAKTEKPAGSELTEEEELKILQKLVKQRRDSATIYREQGRTDLEMKELTEISVIEEYLPESLSEEEITEYIKKLITETGVADMSGMGLIMGRATKELSGRAEGKTISSIVRSLLSKE